MDTTLLLKGLEIAVLRSDPGLLRFVFKRLWDDVENRKALKIQLPTIVAETNWAFVGAWSELINKCAEDRTQEMRLYGMFLIDLMLSVKSTDAFWLSKYVFLSKSIAELPEAAAAKRMMKSTTELTQEAVDQGAGEWDIEPFLKMAKTLLLKKKIYTPYLALQLIALRGLPTKEQFQKDIAEGRERYKSLKVVTYEDLPYFVYASTDAGRKSIKTMAQYVPKVVKGFPDNLGEVAKLVYYLEDHAAKFQIPITDPTAVKPIKYNHTAWMWPTLKLVTEPKDLGDVLTLWKLDGRRQYELYIKWAIGLGAKPQ